MIPNRKMRSAKNRKESGSSFSAPSRASSAALNSSSGISVAAPTVQVMPTRVSAPPISLIVTPRKFDMPFDAAERMKVLIANSTQAGWRMISRSPWISGI